MEIKLCKFKCDVFYERILGCNKMTRNYNKDILLIKNEQKKKAIYCKLGVHMALSLI